MIMAGGRGSRLEPLTTHRAKPAVPIGGRYRICDFVLSNFVNSGYRQIYVLTQYMASSLIRHLNRAWHLSDPGSFIEIVPAQMRRGEQWYLGTADSVAQNLNLVDDHRAPNVAVFGGDHIYMMDVRLMEKQHDSAGAELTISAMPVPIEEASQFGVIEVDGSGRVTGFSEKPKKPKPMPSQPTHALVSMGNYMFRTDALKASLIRDSEDGGSAHDFGKNIIPRMIDEGRRVFAYDFGTNRVEGTERERGPYWRDVGTLDSYFDACMDMRHPLPPLDMYNRFFPIRTARRNYPPARFVTSDSPVHVTNSMVCEGSIVIGAAVHRAMVGYDNLIHRGATVEDAVGMSGCDIGPGCQLRRIILDKNCSVAPGTVIGHDPQRDRERFPFITDGGIAVFPKGTHIPASGPIQLARDMATALQTDPNTKTAMGARADTYVVGVRGRHSFESVGPRFKRFHK